MYACIQVPGSQFAVVMSQPSQSQSAAPMQCNAMQSFSTVYTSLPSWSQRQDSQNLLPSKKKKGIYNPGPSTIISVTPATTVTVIGIENDFDMLGARPVCLAPVCEAVSVGAPVALAELEEEELSSAFAA